MSIGGINKLIVTYEAVKSVGGNRNSIKAINQSTGKKIMEIDLDESRLLITFLDDTQLMIMDAGEGASEIRYLHSDDDLQSFVGSIFTKMEVLYAPDIEDDCEVHEVSFLHVHTDVGVFVVETHNEHNGHYSGFWIVAKLV